MLPLLFALALSPATVEADAGAAEGPRDPGDAAITEQEPGTAKKKAKKPRRVPTRWHGLVRVGGLTDSGPLPDVSLAGELTVGVNGPWVSLQAFGRAWLPRKARLPTVEEPGVSAWAWAGGPRACFRHAAGPIVELPACLGASFGQARASSFGALPQSESRHLWIEGNVTVGVTLTPLPWLGIVGAFESGFLFKSFTLAIGDTAYHEPSHTALRAFLALEFRFPTRPP